MKLRKNERKVMPKVLMFHPALPPYRIDMFNALSERLNLRIVFFLENAVEQKFDQKQLREKLKAKYVYLLKGFKIFGRVFRLGIRDEIRSFKPDIIITTEFSQSTILVWLENHLFGKKIQHVVMTDDNPERIKEDNVIRKLIRRIIITQLDGLIVVSDECAEMFKIKYRINLPIASCPILQSESIFRKKLSMANREADKLAAAYKLYGKRVFLYVGRLADVKRVDRLISAFGVIHESIQDAVLVIVGDGPERDKLKKLTESLGLLKKVIFAGHCEGSQLYAWYRIGSLFVLTSEHEPFGCVVNEALLSGMPVICSNVAGAATLIRTNVNGTVIDAENSLELQTVLREWLKKIKPLSKKNILTLKRSRMLIKFDDVVNQVTDLLMKIGNEK